MKKVTVTPNIAKGIILAHIDKIFEDRLYEFYQNLMLESEQYVEDNYDTSVMQESLDSGEMWYDEIREDVKDHITDKVSELLNVV